MIHYDLHIHSALSPCSDDDMTLNNIINMACLVGLDLIAVTDHNSCKQLFCLREVAKNKIHYLYGVEMQTLENIHVLAYFHEDMDLDRLLTFQHFLDDHLIRVPNDPIYYGNQLIYDMQDHLVDFEEHRLISTSLDVSLTQVIEMVHQLGGSVVLAHLYRKYGYLTVYDSLPNNLPIEGVELSSQAEIDRFVQSHPHWKNRLMIQNSDAHHLYDIQEAGTWMSDEHYQILTGGRSWKI